MTWSVSVPGGNGEPFDTSSFTVNLASSVRLSSCTRWRSGEFANAGTSVAASPDVKSSLGVTSYVIPCGIASAAPNFRMRNVVDMLAAKRPAPMATASSASRCTSNLRPLMAFPISSFTPGTRVLPPMTSIASISSSVMLKSPSEATIARNGPVMRSKISPASVVNSSRVIFDRKSISSCNDSTLNGASLFADRISFVLRTCLRILPTARGIVDKSVPCFCLNSS
mmetsp:Transcript_4383/g.16739  ORF Transcript_4383/g.16739 Transcript_4383/m.16739 type:complete len:225 (+) Transcript_4383:2405-3079(+)